MSLYKDILLEAFESGTNGNSYNDTVVFLQSKYLKIVEADQFDPGGSIHEAWFDGYAEWMEETNGNQ
jgi:hypothetical protein